MCGWHWSLISVTIQMSAITIRQPHHFKLKHTSSMNKSILGLNEPTKLMEHVSLASKMWSGMEPEISHTVGVHISVRSLHHLHLMHAHKYTYSCTSPFIIPEYLNFYVFQFYGHFRNLEFWIFGFLELCISLCKHAWFCEYVYMYVYMLVCMSACKHVCMCACKYIYIYVCMHIGV